MTDKKTDNGNLPAKVKLRRYFLDKYHRGGRDADVFDCCQATGLIWKTIFDHVKVKSYWGVDKKRKAGRLALDSARVLGLGLEANVIDVDTYGSPWEHWQAIVKNLRHATSVFLTIGVVKMGGGGGLSKVQSDALGLGDLKPPPGITAQLHALSFAACVHLHERNIIEACEVQSGSDRVRYIGLHVRP